MRFAHFLENSSSYKNTKQLARHFLTNQKSRAKFYFDIFIIILVIASVSIFIYEVKNPDHPFGDFEIFVLFVFILEYLFRFWVYSDSHHKILEYYEHTQIIESKFCTLTALKLYLKDKLFYMITPIAIIDLLAILPSYRPLRMLRILLLFRLFKLFRYTKSVNTFMEVFYQKRFELQTLGIFLGFVIVISGCAFYVFEANHNPSVDTVFDAIYWSVVTVATVGYGDIVPKTTEGMVVSIVLIMIGISVIAFLTSIIVSGFSNKLTQLSEDRFYLEIEKLDDYAIVCGYGRVSEVISKQFLDHKQKFIVIDTDQEKVNLAKQRGIKAICADATQSINLAKMGISNGVTKIICGTNNDQINILITLTARSLCKNIEIFARLENKLNHKKFLLAGANHIFNPYEITGFMGVHSVTSRVSYEAIYGLLAGKKGIELEEILIAEGSILENKTLQDANLKSQNIVLFGVLRTDGEPNEGVYSYEIGGRVFYFNPKNDFIVRKHDSLIVLARYQKINKLKDEVQYRHG